MPANRSGPVIQFYCWCASLVAAHRECHRHVVLRADCRLGTARNFEAKGRIGGRRIAPQTGGMTTRDSGRCVMRRARGLADSSAHELAQLFALPLERPIEPTNQATASASRARQERPERGRKGQGWAGQGRQHRSITSYHWLADLILLLSAPPDGRQPG
ncbi:unnamed protein product [Protopolystoma xenopodis]|uniref:Uncharacterized protein n=1 Tax=Protopolystoma xenopodis TaxID=117903 RepID=A0A448WT90_9PLAT|nr:unnamed protein product [Protopolystoma xenopodis]